jgi:PKD repeat protein
MRKIFFFLILLAFFACKKNDPEAKPKACFTFSPDTALKTGDTIKFTNCSENATSYLWDFGDSTTSTEKSPVHIFKRGGTYLIKLTAADKNSFDTISLPVMVNVSIPKACFSFSPDTGLKIGDNITFSNCSENATTYLWDFGDGTTSTEKTPVHVFKKGDSFKVKLRSENNYAVDSFTKTVVVIDQYFTDLHDIRIGDIVPGYLKYDLDIDKDNYPDISISVSQRMGTVMAYYQQEDISISLLNDYEISITKDIDTTYHMKDIMDTTSITCDTFDSPVKYNINSKIKVDGSYSGNSTNVVYFYFYDPSHVKTNYTITIWNSWISSDYRYMAFRKKTGNSYILAWIKIKVKDFEHVYLNSCKYFVNKDEVVISE